ncbi:MAG: epimerase, partial [Deltaproteobacteria bacterium]|nr:epimerase [Deltaproteobacteria bacterium]
LTFRSIDDTVKATLEWFKKEPKERQEKLKAGIKPEREVEVLKTWHDEHK